MTTEQTWKLAEKIAVESHVIDAAQDLMIPVIVGRKAAEELLAQTRDPTAHAPAVEHFRVRIHHTVNALIVLQESGLLNDNPKIAP